VASSDVHGYPVPGLDSSTAFIGMAGSARNPSPLSLSAPPRLVRLAQNSLRTVL